MLLEAMARRTSWPHIVGFKGVLQKIKIKEKNKEKFGGEVELNIDLLARPQPTKIHEQKAKTSNSSSEVGILDVRGKTDLSHAGTTAILRKEPEDDLKKDQDSLSLQQKLKKRAPPPQGGNSPKKPEPKKEKTSRRLRA